MRKKNIILTIIIATFIGVNVFLVVTDHSHKVDRVTFISDWTDAEEKELQETIVKDGVLDYAFENYIYLEDTLGTFNEFLVEEGDTVQAGEDLYTYEAEQPYEMLLQLQQKEDELTESIQAIETALNEIETTDITQEEFNFVYPDDSEAGTFRQNISSAQMMKEQYRIEKEKELGEMQAELHSIETQVVDLQTGQEAITVASPYDGRVTDIDTTLDNPLMTIEDLELYAVGELTEKERMDVETGMLTEITLNENDEVFEGNVTDIDEDPKRLHLKGRSAYSFYSNLEEPFDEEGEDADDDGEAFDEDLSENEASSDEEDEVDITGNENEFDSENENTSEIKNDEGINKAGDSENLEENSNADEDAAENEAFTKDELLKGYHADIKIILEENPEAIAVSDKLVKNNKLWLMNLDGELVNEPIVTGIKDGGEIEVISDEVEEGQWLALKPRPQFRDESHFITPIKPGRTTWKAIYEDGARKRSILIGLLGR